MSRAAVSILLLLTGFAWVGCDSNISSNPSDYVGEYVFRPSVDVPAQFANFLILKGDQEAVEIRFDKNTGQVQSKIEKWYLSRTTGQNLVIGSFSCSVEGTRSAIKLSVNDDLGQYYEKIR